MTNDEVVKLLKLPYIETVANYDAVLVKVKLLPDCETVATVQYVDGRCLKLRAVLVGSDDWNWEHFRTAAQTGGEGCGTLAQLLLSAVGFQPLRSLRVARLRMEVGKLPMVSTKADL